MVNDPNHAKRTPEARVARPPAENTTMSAYLSLAGMLSRRNAKIGTIAQAPSATVLMQKATRLAMPSDRESHIPSVGSHFDATGWQLAKKLMITATRPALEAPTTV